MKIYALLVALFFSFNLFASISILSDLDDTIKITQSGEVDDLFGSDVFMGIPEFFSGAQNYSNELHILSASPSVLGDKIKKTLKKHGIIYESLTLRKNVFERKFEYKVNAIEKLLLQSSDDFILIGDDLGEDPEVYAEIKKRYPSRVVAVYIHVSNGRPFSTDAQRYWTSFDLFLREYLAGRMSDDWVDMMATKFLALNEEELELVFPEKAECPEVATVWEWQLATVFQPEAYSLIQKFNSYCQQRQSDIISP